LTPTVSNKAKFHKLGVKNLPIWQPCFSAALFSVDARFGRKDEKPYKLIEKSDTTKQTHAHERTSSEHNIKKKKTCKYVVPSS